LPEVIGDAGLTLEISSQYTPDTRTAPTPQEVEIWVNNIIHLWDDANFYHELSLKGRQRTEIWNPNRVAVEYERTLLQLVM
jgi:hypothetical protein